MFFLVLAIVAAVVPLVVILIQRNRNGYILAATASVILLSIPTINRVRSALDAPQRLNAAARVNDEAWWPRLCKGLQTRHYRGFASRVSCKRTKLVGVDIDVLVFDGANIALARLLRN